MKLSLIPHALFMLFASSAAMPNDHLFSSWRPCCSVAQDFYTQKLSYTKTVSLRDLGSHHVGNKSTVDEKENNGLIYTCRYGLIDTAHIRDAADWTQEALKYVEANIGMKNRKTVNSDGTKRVLRFNRMSVADLNQEDLIKISGRLVFENTIWHEMASGMDLIEFQWMSSFSPEDIFSDLLGVRLAMAALQKGGDFDSEMTKLIYDFVKGAQPLSGTQTQALLDNQEGILWKKGLFFSDLVIRDFSVYGDVHSYRVPSETACLNIPQQSLPGLESRLSNNKMAGEYFDYVVVVNEKMDLIFKKYGFTEYKDDITDKDFPRILPVIEKYVDRETDFLTDLPIEIHGCDKFNYYRDLSCLKHIADIFAEKILN